MQPPRPAQRPRRRGLGAGAIVGIGLAVVVALCGLGVLAVALGGSHTATTTQPNSGGVPEGAHNAPTEAAPPPKPAGPQTAFGDGTWLVGTDVVPGTYRTTVPADSENCYWSRLRDVSGTMDSIIANDNVDPGRQAVVTIGRGDKAFKSDGCGTWTKIG